jgi:hypothetical protein
MQSGRGQFGRLTVPDLTARPRSPVGGRLSGVLEAEVRAVSGGVKLAYNRVFRPLIMEK